ncbi:hypothetical protein D9M70_485400 [compost metagenome]
MAEITKGRGGKNRQIDLKKNIAEGFFGGVSAAHTCLLLAKNGNVESTDIRGIGTKKSDNFYVELSGLNGTVSGSYRERPLLLVEKKPNEYRYFWLYPSDSEFNAVYDAIIQPETPNRQGNQSIKLVVPYSDLYAVWAANPFALAGP